MKWILVAFLGLVALVIAALFVAPSLIDWKPRLIEAVRASTGRQLRINGPLQVSFFPEVQISAADIHLANAPGTSQPEMLSIARLKLEIALWPLIMRHVVIRSLDIQMPSIDLEVNKDGEANWVFAPTFGTNAEKPEAPPTASSRGDLGAIQFDRIQIENGRVSYLNAETGQTLRATDISLKAAMGDPATPLRLDGHMTLNDQPVTTELAIDSLARLQQGAQAKVKVEVNTRDLTAHFDGAAQAKPIAGLNGTFDLNVPSVGALLSWLHRPLPKSQPDPGPLKIHAVFAASGAESALKDLSLTGTGLNAKATGTVDARGRVTKVALDVESGLLDLDRYLPPPAKVRPAARAVSQPAAMPAKDLLAAVSDHPFDLKALRDTDADIKVAIAGIKYRGQQIGPIAFNTVAKGGALTANLRQFALYGGNVKGLVALNAVHDALGLDADVTIDHVRIDQATEAQIGHLPVAGTINATLHAKANGRSPRGLAENLEGKLTLDLGGVAMRGRGAGLISAAKVDLEVPGPGKPSHFNGSLVYNGEAISADATLAPLRQLLSGGRSPAKVAVDSKLFTIRYDGALQHRPVPAVEGSFDLNIPSVGKLAAWAGQPLATGQPDPGPLKVHALVTGDGAKLALKAMSVTGKAIQATAGGTFDRSSKVATFNAKVDVQQADLNAYLPPPAKGGGTTGPRHPAARPAKGWNTAAFDLTPLGRAEGQAVIQLNKVRYRDLAIVKGTIRATLANRVLTIAAQKLELAQGVASATASLDNSGSQPKLSYQASGAGIQARPLLQTFAGTGRLSGAVQFDAKGQASGRSEKAMIDTLGGSGSFKVTNGAIYGINLAQTLRKVGTLGFGPSTTERTDFAELSGSYTIKSGVIDNRDLKMLAPLVRLSGSGTVPMPPRTIDYTVEAKLVPTIKGQGGQDALAGLPIPIKVTGPWSGPSYKVDWASVFQTIAKDPTRLKNLPANLSQAAKGFGVNLPISGGLGQTLQNLPGIPKAGTPAAPAPATPGSTNGTQPPSTPTLPNIKKLFGQ